MTDNPRCTGALGGEAHRLNGCVDQTASERTNDEEAILRSGPDVCCDSRSGPPSLGRDRDSKPPREQPADLVPDPADLVPDTSYLGVGQRLGVAVFLARDGIFSLLPSRAGARRIREERL